MLVLFIQSLWHDFLGLCKFLACFAVMLSPFAGIALIEKASSEGGLHAGATSEEGSVTDWPDAHSGSCK